jgi:hypothetical protein
MMAPKPPRATRLEICLPQPKALDRHVFDARLSEIEIVSQGLRLPNRFTRGCAMIASLDPR